MFKKSFCFVLVLFVLVFVIGCSDSDEPSVTDAEAVAAAKSLLVIGFAGGDDANNVSQNVSLTNAGSSGTTVGWASDNTGVVAVDGAVVRPAYGSGNATVTLTATITKGSESDTKVFTLTVKEAQQTDAEAVAAVKSTLAIGFASGDDANNVSQNVSLTNAGSNGTTVSWASDSIGVISVNGTVIRPASISGNATVILTATITKGSASDTKVFNVTVKAEGPQLSGVAGAAASASSWDGSHLPANAIDGGSSSRWANLNTSAYPAWLAVDLGSEYTFNHSTFNFESSPSGGFYLQYSTDGTNWNSIGALRTAGTDFTFSAVSAQYFRIYAPDGLGSSWFSIYEMTLNYQ